MYNPDNIFAKILLGKVPSKVIYEDQEVLSFYDAYPAAPVHAIVIPKGEYLDYDHFVNKATPLAVGYFFSAIPHIAKLLNLDSYRLITNKGASSGQSIFHFHMHIIGGVKLDTLI
jgi:histidine triad (HIT) family protein